MGGQQQHTRSGAARRRLVAALGVGPALSGLLPHTWHRPLVGAISLPAHAQLSPVFTLSCEVLGNGTITPSVLESISITIDPPPGPDVPIQAVGSCPSGGTLFNVGGVFDFTSGQAVTTVSILPGQCTTPGETLSVVLTANTLGGASDTCLFTVT